MVMFSDQPFTRAATNVSSEPIGEVMIFRCVRMQRRKSGRFTFVCAAIQRKDRSLQMALRSSRRTFRWVTEGAYAAARPANQAQNCAGCFLGHLTTWKPPTRMSPPNTRKATPSWLSGGAIQPRYWLVTTADFATTQVYKKLSEWLKSEVKRSIGTQVGQAIE